MKFRIRHEPDLPPLHISDEEILLTVGDAIALAKTVWFGSPGSCPSCGRRGELMWIDVERGRSRSRCEECDVAWVLLKADDGRALPPPARGA